MALKEIRRGSSKYAENMFFAMRPTGSGFSDKSSWNQPMLLKANSYRLKVKHGFEVQKYALAYTPEIPNNSKVSFKIMKSCREKLKEKFASYMIHGNFLFSTSMLEFDAENYGLDYKVEIKWTKNVTKDPLVSGAFR